MIVKELLGWISDSSATVVGVDLAAANRSNRFYGEFRVKDDGGAALIDWRDAEASFVYRHVGTTLIGRRDSYECHDWLGGSGVFGTVALFCLERDRAVASRLTDHSLPAIANVLKILGQFPLGDRYDGDIRLTGTAYSRLDRIRDGSIGGKKRRGGCPFCSLIA